jgi:uncharacterized protein (DUF1800 family)
VFRDTDGDIKSVVRAVLTSEEFRASAGLKIKRPFRFVVSSLRLMGADTHAHQPLLEYLNRMGQGLFAFPTPDGYPDESTAWLGTLLWRWNFAFALAANETPSVTVSIDELAKAIGGSVDAGLRPDCLLAHFTGRKATPDELRALSAFEKGSSSGNAKRAELLALVLASPAFQRC